MLHVLLIEDNPSDVMLIREAMRRSEVPADVEIVYSGDEAVKLMPFSAFDLVILDLNIPRFHGHAILARCFEVPGIPPIYVFSGSNDPQDRKAALALGAKDHIVKPRDFEQFMQAVRRMLEHSESACA